MKKTRRTRRLIRNILVPLDGSKNSIRALKEAINLAKYTKSKIKGIYVISNDVSSLPLVDLLQPLSALKPIGFKQKLRTYSKKIIEGAEELCKPNGIKFSGTVIEGNPGYEIVKISQAKENQINLIVIGSRGKGPTTEIFLGSVSNYVIHKAKKPVMIVK